MSASYLSIGGLLIRVDSEAPAPAGLIGDRLRAFEISSPSRDPDVRLLWRSQDPTAIRLGETLFDPGSIWRLHRSHDNQGYVAVVAYGDDGRLTRRASVIEADMGWSDCRLTEAVDHEGWSSLLNLGVGELLVRTRIVRDRGILFHSSAVDDSGKGILMVGHSGAGKSTQSLIWAEQPRTVVLSDDRVAVRLAGDAPTAFGTPWGGTAGIAKNSSVPLNVILVLEQSPTNELIPLTPEQALPLLLVRSFLPYWDGELINAAMDTLLTIIERTRVYVFRCRADASVIPIVRSVL